ncbi:MAG: cold shock domain-containing protein [Bacteroidales bacterium]|jgi:CspA family cold shock protein|nr:cold shock domain-containing protein [Bacteroidales bacterium]
MNQGTVKFFNELKGFGFIKDDKTGKDFFVGANGLKVAIKENDKVSFDIEEGPKGPIATNVKNIG